MIVEANHSYCGTSMWGIEILVSPLESKTFAFAIDHLIGEEIILPSVEPQNGLIRLTVFTSKDLCEFETIWTNLDELESSISNVDSDHGIQLHNWEFGPRITGLTNLFDSVSIKNNVEQFTIIHLSASVEFEPSVLDSVRSHRSELNAICNAISQVSENPGFAVTIIRNEGRELIDI